MLQFDGLVIQERQEQWADLAPDSVCVGLCEAFFDRFEGHMKNKYKNMPLELQADKLAYKLRTGQSLTSAQLPKDKRIEWLRENYGFPVKDHRDFAKLLLAHPSVACLEATSLFKRARAGKCSCGPQNANEYSLRHVLLLLQAS